MENRGVLNAQKVKNFSFERETLNVEFSNSVCVSSFVYVEGRASKNYNPFIFYPTATPRHSQKGKIYRVLRVSMAKQLNQLCPAYTGQQKPIKQASHNSSPAEYVLRRRSTLELYYIIRCSMY